MNKDEMEKIDITKDFEVLSVEETRKLIEEFDAKLNKALKDNIVNRIGTKYAVIDLTDIAQLAKENGIELE